MSAAVAVPRSTTMQWYLPGSATDREPRSHLLARSWQPRRGGTRPSLCGQWRRMWDTVEDRGDADRYTPCEECDQLAQAHATDAAPVTTTRADLSRYQATAGDSDRFAHFLAETVPDGRGIRTALCGQRRQVWRAIAARSYPDWPLCRGCAEAVPEPAPRPPARIAPVVAAVDTRPLVLSEPVRNTTPAERAVRRGQFLRSIPRAPGIDDYVPLAERERLALYAAPMARLCPEMDDGPAPTADPS